MYVEQGTETLSPSYKKRSNATTINMRNMTCRA